MTPAGATSDGAYQLLISVANKMQTRLIGPPLTDYDATVEARFASDNLGSYGLVAAARGPNDYYALMIDGDQRYAITRRTPQGTQAIRDWTFSPALNEGQAVNHLRAVQRGNEIAFYANDVLLKIIQDEGDPQAKRSIGLTAASFNTGTDVRFDNLRVCPPPDRLCGAAGDAAGRLRRQSQRLGAPAVSALPAAAPSRTGSSRLSRSTRARPTSS